tara:strand:+ start:346 stop:462 length:117 start_codon:yes stop_codon:yes gene_type:complete
VYLYTTSGGDIQEKMSTINIGKRKHPRDKGSTLTDITT